MMESSTNVDPNLNAILEELTELAAEGSSLKSLKKIDELCRKQDKLKLEYESLNMRNVLLDLEIIYRVTKHIGGIIKNIGGNKISIMEYADALRTNITSDEGIKWTKLTKIAAQAINRAPGINILPMGRIVNCIKPEEVVKEKKVRTQTQDKIGEKIRPDKVITVNNEDESVNSKINYVSETLKKCYVKNGEQQIDFYKFFLNPTSYSRTIENLFYIACLIRDGLAALDTSEDTFFIKPILVQDNSIKKGKHQMIFNIDMDQWTRLLKEKNVTKPLIKWRD